MRQCPRIWPITRNSFFAHARLRPVATSTKRVSIGAPETLIRVWCHRAIKRERRTKAGLMPPMHVPWAAQSAPNLGQPHGRVVISHLVHRDFRARERDGRCSRQKRKSDRCDNGTL